jgi:hypothetical protein
MKIPGNYSSARLSTFFGGLLAFLLLQAAAGAAQVKVTATYHERIALTRRQRRIPGAFRGAGDEVTLRREKNANPWN